jgi:uncharacterized paraquat-inducible protein A
MLQLISSSGPRRLCENSSRNQLLEKSTLTFRFGLTADRARTYFKFVSHLGKWSMLDVFVVAILVLTVKSGGVASINVQGGFFLFFISVMLTQFASTWTGRIASRLEK